MLCSLRLWVLVCAACVGMLGCGSHIPENPYDPHASSSVRVSSVLVGVVRSEGVGMAGVAVSAKPWDETSSPVGTTTDSTGHYMLKNVPSGTVKITAVASTAYAFAEDVTLLPGETKTLDITLQKIPQLPQAPGYISGTALKTRTGQTVSDHSNIVVEVVGTGARTVTNAEGAFDIAVAAGTYTLSFSATGFQTHFKEGVVSVSGERRPLEDGPVMLEQTLGSVEGTVALEGMQEGRFNDSWVRIEALQRETRTNNEGRFVFSNIPEGIYTVAIQHPGYGPQTITGVAVQPGVVAQTPLAVLTMARGHITGHVSLEGASDHSGIEISIEGTSLNTFTGSDGAFAFQYVPVGTHALSIRKQGYLSIRTAVTVDSDHIPVHITLDPLRIRPGDFILENGNEWTRTRTITVALSEQPNTGVRLSENPLFTGAPWLSWQASLPFTLSEDDGLKTVYVQYREDNGLVSSIYRGSIVLDTTPPQTTRAVFNNAEQYTRNAWLDFSINATDTGSGLASMAVFPSGTPSFFVPFSYQTKIAVYDNEVSGLKTYHVLLTDKAGNTTSVPFQASVQYDITPPVLEQVKLRCHNGGNTCAYPTAVLEAQSADAVAWGFGYDPQMRDATWVPFDGRHTLSLDPDEGEHGVYVQAEDIAGNKSAITALSISVDTTAPTLTQVQALGRLKEHATASATTHTAFPAIQLSIAATDPSDIVSVQWSHTPSFQEASIQPYSTEPYPWELRGADGVHAVYVQVTDAAGNRNTYSTSLFLDTTPPSLQAASAYGSFVRTPQALIQLWSLDTETVETTEDIPQWQPFDWNILVPLSAQDGYKQLRITGYDAAGNASAVHTVAFTHDQTPPSIAFFQATGNALPGETHRVSNTPVITLTTTPSAHTQDVVSMRISTTLEASQNTGWIPYQTSLTYTLPPYDNTYTLYVWLQDRAGNISLPLSTQTDLDTQAPKIPSLPAIPLQIREGDLLIEGPRTVVDAHPVVYRIATEGPVLWESTQTPPWRIPFSHGWDYGTYQVTLQAIDTAGNTSLFTLGTVQHNPLSHAPQHKGGLYNSLAPSQTVHAEGITAALFAHPASLSVLDVSDLSSVTRSTETPLPYPGRVLRMAYNKAYIAYGTHADAPGHIERLSLHKNAAPTLDAVHTTEDDSIRFMDVWPYDADTALVVYAQNNVWHAGKITWECDEDCIEEWYTLPSNSYNTSYANTTTWALALGNDGVLVFQNIDTPQPMATHLPSTHFNDTHAASVLVNNQTVYVALQDTLPSLTTLDMQSTVPHTVHVLNNVNCNHMHLSGRWLVCAGNTLHPRMALIDLLNARTPRIAQRWGSAETSTYSITGWDNILLRSHTGYPSLEAWEWDLDH